MRKAKRRRGGGDTASPSSAPSDSTPPSKAEIQRQRLGELRRDNPWPELPDALEPFYLSLDAGGRHLVTDVISERGVSLMAEVGCFLCGSTRQWLESRPELTVIGIDPWDDNWGNYIRQKSAEHHGSMRTLKDPAATARALDEYGNYRSALKNVEQWRDRFIPLRQWSPAALHYLKRRGIYPELIYIDAYKEEEDLQVAHEVFPGAILCGDDWDWPDEHGVMVMQENVERFASEFGFSIEAEGATWLLTRTGKPTATASAPRAASAPRDSQRADAVRRGLATAIVDRFGSVIERPDLRDAEVLVVGADAGSVEALIEQRAPLARYVGISPDTEMVERLRRDIADDRFAFHHVDPDALGDALPIDDRPFDLICAVSVFDHLDPDGYRRVLTALRRYAGPTTRLAYTLLVDEATPGGDGAMDAFARALGADVVGQTEQFRDFLPDEPLRMALYEKEFALELLRGTGWALVELQDPTPPFQHFLIAESVPPG